MIGLDTNVLVRYLTQDDPDQSKKANRCIQQAIDKRENCLVNAVVLCETVWILESAYGFRKAEILAALESILLASQFEIPQKDMVWPAFNDFREGKAGFSDCLIGRLNLGLGCRETVSFDRDLRGKPGFHLL